MLDKYIPLIVHIMDKMVMPDDMKRKYTDSRILKILVLLQIFRVSYPSAGIFLQNIRKSQNY
jgi:hypothetical protein